MGARQFESSLDPVARGIQPFHPQLSFRGIGVEREVAAGFDVPGFEGDLPDLTLWVQPHPTIAWEMRTPMPVPCALKSACQLG